MMPKLSVVIPVFNKEKYLQATLESVVNQTFTDSEIIIIDDGSTDSSFQICEEFKQKCSRIKIIRQQNLGASAARNVGISNAKGKYLVVVDADDFIEPNMHEELVIAAEQYNCDMVCCGYYGGGIPVIYDFPSNCFLNRKYILEEIVPNSIGLQKNHNSLGTHWCVLYSLSTIKENHIQYNETQTKEEDKPFIIKNLFFSSSICFVDKALYHYIKRPSSLMSNYSHRFENIKKNLNLYEELFGDMYNFNSKEKIQYNVCNLIECLEFVIIHKNDCNMKKELLSILASDESKDWFTKLEPYDDVSSKLKQYVMKEQYDMAANYISVAFVKKRFGNLKRKIKRKLKLK